MKKVLKVNELDCAVCAGKIEDGVKALDHVSSCSVNFITQKLILDVEDEHYKDTFKEIKKICKKVNSDLSVEE